MKKIIVLFLVFLALKTTNAQINKGAVFYKKSYTEKTFVKNEKNNRNFNKFKEIEEGFLKVLEEIEYKLKFKGGISSFQVVNSLILEENIHARMALIPEGKGEFYNSNEIRLNEQNIFGENFLVSDEDLKWELKNETKKIGEYICNKAIAIEARPYRGKMKDFPITAWYCPEINAPFGPIGISGLPGLILQVDTGKIRYTAIRINLNPKKEIQIKKPTKGKKITQKKLDEMIDGSMDDFKKNKGY